MEGLQVQERIKDEHCEFSREAISERIGSKD